MDTRRGVCVGASRIAGSRHDLRESRGGFAGGGYGLAEASLHERPYRVGEVKRNDGADAQRSGDRESGAEGGDRSGKVSVYGKGRDSGRAGWKLHYSGSSDGS